MRSITSLIVTFPLSFPASRSTFSKSQMSKKCIEIEEKFPIHNLDKTISKLNTLGFEQCKETVKFMDWYFDIPNDWSLCRSDCWLRYRHLGWDKEGNDDTRKGSWQLKKGRTDLTGVSSSTTIYEEFEGDDAFELIEKMIPIMDLRPKEDAEMTMDGYRIPILPRAQVLQPFARIGSFRSSWKHTTKWENVVVDLDGTDFGHTVGEVEVVLDHDGNEEMKQAQDLIREIIAKLIEDETRNGSAMGKLETYLIAKKPEVYKACVESGTMKTRNSETST